VKCQPPLVVISHESVHSRSIKWCFDLLILPLIIFFSYPMISWVNNKVKCQIQFPSSISIPLCNHVLEFPDTHNYTSQAKYTSYWIPWANWIKLSQLKKYYFDFFKNKKYYFFNIKKLFIILIQSLIDSINYLGLISLDFMEFFLIPNNFSVEIWVIPF
jgi:hypothetical protein